MNRCYAPSLTSPSRRTLVRMAGAMPLLGLAALASAQVNVRPFPPNAERGSLVVIAPPVIQLGGKPERLSPGARIRGLNNMLLMSGALIGQNLLVNFVRNPTGEVHEVWVLTEAEAALKLPTQQP
jgi:hypothetical protein